MKTQMLSESLWSSFLSSFNQLCLPTYDSYEELHKMLKLAISEGSEGFGMLWLSNHWHCGSNATRGDERCTLQRSDSLHSSPFNSGLLYRESPRLWIDSLSGREGVTGAHRRLSWDRDSMVWILVLLYVYKISRFCKKKKKKRKPRTAEKCEVWASFIS